MDLGTILDMATDASPEREAVGGTDSLTFAALRRAALRGACELRSVGATELGYLAPSSPDFAVALFAAAYAGIPFVPINYRQSAAQLEEILGRYPRMLLLTDDEQTQPNTVSAHGFAETAKSGTSDDRTDLGPVDPDGVAVMLMTSGTTASPKSAVLRHRHLTSYLLTSVDFAGAAEDESALIAVPPYHVAAVANLLSNVFAGRRVVYLDHFTPTGWIDVVEHEHITQAMVVPTMLARLVAELQAQGRTGPGGLRTLSYGGAKLPRSVLIAALHQFPNTGFVNGYGLTETSSSIAVLGPDDHRRAVTSSDLAVVARLESAGRALPGVEIRIVDGDGTTCAAGVEGEIIVRGPQVAGEYRETGTSATEAGWFHTKDRGYLDAEEYLFVRGRIDDTIIRGGENIAPAEIEDVLALHDAVHDVVVAGYPDDEWGQRIAAFIVVRSGAMVTADDIRDFARSRLRSSKTPDLVSFVEEFPFTPTGKILRRTLVEDLPRAAV